jgi:ABC-type uncharacterized transport system permease subunit
LFTIAEWLSRITLSCFAFSYLLTMILEVSRLFFQVVVRRAIILGMTALGLFAHTVYICLEIRSGLEIGAVPLADWHAWCVLAALVLAVIYFVLSIRRPQNNIGLFLLPLVLGLVVTAALVNNTSSFSQQEALSVWDIIHGISLLAATVTMALGCATGVMYLAQSYRLKKKLAPRRGLRLPSLEWLQRNNSRCLFIATILVGIGLVAGVVMNANDPEETAKGGVVISSAILLCWLVTVLLFEYFYKPARQGRKIAYLTVASFVFLALVLGIVILGKHAADDLTTTQLPSTSVPGKREAMR